MGRGETQVLEKGGSHAKFMKKTEARVFLVSTLVKWRSVRQNSHLQPLMFIQNTSYWLLNVILGG